jgi:SAM-dependent methyltransferase
MVDWSAGEYERTAVELEPAARRVIERAEIAPGERVLDVACGTGNAALLAAAAGARATGLDSAPRLVEVARQRAAADGADAEFVVGDALDLPFDDGALDAVVSVFGLIFAPDPDRAIAEVRRVLGPNGRAVLSAWVPDGAVHRMVGVLGRGLVAAGGPSRPSFSWHDPDAIAGLAAAQGATVTAEDERLAIVGESPEAYFAAAEEHHPMSLAGRPLLEQAGTYATLRDEAIGVLRDANEDPVRFRVTSPYRVIRLGHAAVTR